VNCSAREPSRPTASTIAMRSGTGSHRAKASAAFSASKSLQNTQSAGNASGQPTSATPPVVSSVVVALVVGSEPLEPSASFVGPALSVLPAVETSALVDAADVASSPSSEPIPPPLESNPHAATSDTLPTIHPRIPFTPPVERVRDAAVKRLGVVARSDRLTTVRSMPCGC